MKNKEKKEVILSVFKYQNDGIDKEVVFNGATFMLSQISETLGKISFEASMAEVFGRTEINKK
jgi:hypothetical protein